MSFLNGSGVESAMTNEKSKMENGKWVALIDKFESTQRRGGHGVPPLQLAPESYCGEGPWWYTAAFPTGDTHRALNDRRKLLKIIMRSRLRQFLVLTVTMPGLTCARFSLSAIVRLPFIPYHPDLILSVHVSPMRAAQLAPGAFTNLKEKT